MELKSYKTFLKEKYNLNEIAFLAPLLMPLAGAAARMILGTAVRTAVGAGARAAATGAARGAILRQGASGAMRGFGRGVSRLGTRQGMRKVGGEAAQMAALTMMMGGGQQQQPQQNQMQGQQGQIQQPQSQLAVQSPEPGKSPGAVDSRHRTPGSSVFAQNAATQRNLTFPSASPNRMRLAASFDPNINNTGAMLSENKKKD